MGCTSTGYSARHSSTYHPVTHVEVKNVLWTVLQLQPISTANALPNTCARIKARWKKAIKVSTLDHEASMKEATKCDRLEYKEDNEDKSVRISGFDIPVGLKTRKVFSLAAKIISS
jgi:hypothetical protein